MYWLLEKWGGSRGSCAAYAAAVADAIGPPRGNFVYARLIERIAPNYPSGFFVHSQIDRGRVLEGLREGMRTGYWQQASTIESLLMLGKSYGGVAAAGRESTYGRQAIQLSKDLADYYKSRYPMLLTQGTRSRDSNLLTPYLSK